MKKPKSTPKPPSPTPEHATLPFRLVESDSPNGPWTPIPDDAYSVRVQDLELARMENPVLDEMVPVDDRTELGMLAGIPEMLGFTRLPLVRQHLGDGCKKRDVRNWLRKRNIDGRDINWTDFCALLQDQQPASEHGEGDRQEDSHHYYPRAMSKKEIGSAFGQDTEDRKVAKKVNALFRSWDRELKRVGHGQYLVPLDGMPKHFFKQFKEHVKLCHGVDLP